jgi:hypothetical protein
VGVSLGPCQSILTQDLNMPHATICTLSVDWQTKAELCHFKDQQFFLKLITGDQIETGTLNKTKCDYIIIIQKQ